MRARGLKHFMTLINDNRFESRSLRARGLKPDSWNAVWATSVALLAGAWIETLMMLPDWLNAMSRSLRARGLKPVGSKGYYRIGCRAPCGRVD